MPVGALGQALLLHLLRERTAAAALTEESGVQDSYGLSLEEASPVSDFHCGHVIVHLSLWLWSRCAVFPCALGSRETLADREAEGTL